MSQTGAVDCKNCLPGKKGVSDGQTACEKCDKGQYLDGSATDLTKCNPCTKGEYQDQDGTTFCVSVLNDLFQCQFLVSIYC